MVIAPWFLFLTSSSDFRGPLRLVILLLLVSFIILIEGGKTTSLVEQVFLDERRMILERRFVLLGSSEWGGLLDIRLLRVWYTMTFLWAHRYGRDQITSLTHVKLQRLLFHRITITTPWWPFHKTPTDIRIAIIAGGHKLLVSQGHVDFVDFWGLFCPLLWKTYDLLIKICMWLSIGRPRFSW